jgi:hypothetical protein
LRLGIAPLSKAVKKLGPFELRVAAVVTYRMPPIFSLTRDEVAAARCISSYGWSRLPYITDLYSIWKGDLAIMKRLPARTGMSWHGLVSYRRKIKTKDINFTEK